MYVWHYLGISTRRKYTRQTRAHYIGIATRAETGYVKLAQYQYNVTGDIVLYIKGSSIYCENLFMESRYDYPATKKVRLAGGIPKYCYDFSLQIYRAHSVVPHLRNHDVTPTELKQYEHTSTPR